MRKIFLLLPVIMLIAAGCDSSTPQQNGSYNSGDKAGSVESAQTSADIDAISNALNEDLSAEASISSKTDADLANPAASVDGITGVENAQ